MDKDQAEALKGMWDYVCIELDSLIERERSALELCKPEDASKHQERIRVYRQIKNLPDDVLSR